MKDKSKVTVHQELVLQAFRPYETDIDIVVIYTRVYGDPGDITVRKMQQKLAPTFKLLNSKLPKNRIVLGDLKRTYRLIKKV